MQEYRGVPEQIRKNMETVRRNAEVLGRSDLAEHADLYFRGGQDPKLFVRVLTDIYRDVFNDKNSVRAIFSGYEKLEGEYGTWEIGKFRDNLERAILRDLE